jgi:hypothetical protein
MAPSFLLIAGTPHIWLNIDGNPIGTIFLASRQIFENGTVRYVGK